jgi:hypothetical protein
MRDIPARHEPSLDVMAEMPPDLEALGDALTRATGHAAAVRQHRAALRRRLAACVVAGMLVFAAMTPSRLGGADDAGLLQRFAAAPAMASGFGCDRPRGQGGYLPQGCDIGKLQPQAAR